MLASRLKDNSMSYDVFSLHPLLREPGACQ
jgi:hypothetical protein